MLPTPADVAATLLRQGADLLTNFLPGMPSLDSFLEQLDDRGDDLALYLERFNPWLMAAVAAAACEVALRRERGSQAGLASSARSAEDVTIPWSPSVPGLGLIDE